MATEMVDIVLAPVVSVFLFFFGFLYPFGLEYARFGDTPCICLGNLVLAPECIRIFRIAWST